MKSIYIYGASGHGIVVADIAKSCGYEDIVFIDDGENGYDSFEDIKENNHIPIAFGIGCNKTREKLSEKVQNRGFKVISLIHPSSIIADTVEIEYGTVIMPNVVVNGKTSIGKCVILNTGSIIEHECNIESFVHISPKVALAGNVIVKANTHIGIGSIVIQEKTIGKNSVIGAGSVVVNNIPDNVKAYGNPCKIVEEI